MLLESFRHDPIGLPLFCLTNRNQSSETVQATYINYAFRAFYLTMQDIEQLEHSKGDLVPDGRNSIVAVSLWFLALESYINTLLKLTCLHLNKDFNNYKSKKVTEKFTLLLELLTIDSLQIKKSGLQNRMNEFTTFRNEIFHDRNIGQPIQFNKTLFSVIPVNCNIIDVLQGLLIFLEVSSLMRYSISPLDTMPDIFIHVNKKAFHKKFDLLFTALIKPSFEEVLAKHQLKTNLNLDISFPEPILSKVFTENDATALIVTDSPKHYYFLLNSNETHICGSLLLKLVEAENITQEKFKIGNYIV